MFSWLNFEELLIHNPIELINPSKDTISVAMNKKQYIEFFSNKYTYNGLYYDEEMDFCLFYYADPLQSVKEGDVYAQGYIDVEMKIYRVKWLCNVSISRLNSSDANFNLLTDTKEFKNKDLLGINQKTSIVSPYSTVLKDGNDTYLKFVSTADNQYWLDCYLKPDWSTTPPPDFINANILPNSKYTFSFWAKGTGVHTVTAYDKWTTPPNVFRDFTLTNDWKFYSFTVTSSDTIPVKNVEFFLRCLTTGSEINLKKPKVEEGDKATPYMQAESEITSKWNVSKTEMIINPKTKAITTVLNGALAKCTKDKDVTGWRNSQPNANYNYRQPQYSLDIGADDFIISGYGLRGLKNG